MSDVKKPFWFNLGVSKILNLQYLFMFQGKNAVTFEPTWLKDIFINSHSHMAINPLMLLMMQVQASHKTTETH